MRASHPKNKRNKNDRTRSGGVSPHLEASVDPTESDTSSAFSLQFFYPDSSEKALAVIRGVQIIYLDLSAVGRSVDKLILANINSHVGPIPSLPKKDEIAFLQLVLLNLLSDRELFSGGPGKFNIKHSIDFFYKSRTIDPL